MVALSSQSYVFDPRPNYPLLITAKRSWEPASLHLHDPDAVTLIFAHGTSFHKEQWEPTIDDLLELVDRKSDSVKIREMWSIDAPNHGDAAVLNEETLRFGYEPIFGWEEYARAIYMFLTGFGTGVDVDFSTHKLVGIGHSMGAVSLMLSLGYSSDFKFESLILCELMALSKKHHEKAEKFLQSGSLNRRDTWPSREEAYKSFKSKPSWKAWDDRVLNLFIRHGLRPFPTASYQDRTEGVTLKCSRIQERATYLDRLGPTRAYNLLPPLVRRLPIHMIYGAIDDYVSREGKDEVVNKAVGGVQNLASLSFVEGAGHLVVQTNPKGLAKSIYDALAVNQSVKVAVRQ